MESNQNFGDLLNNTSGSNPSGQQSDDSFGSLLNASQQPKPTPRPAPTATPAPQASSNGVRGLAAQEGAEHLLPIIGAIHSQESNAGANARTSIDGAQGGMQIMPDTFRRFARPGERIDNADDNMRVGIRYIKSLGDQFGNDPAKIATGYFSGAGNVNNGQGQAWKNDAADGNGKRVSSYVADVLQRVAGVGNAQAASTGPDLGKAPKWADVQAKPEFQALSPEDQAKTKQAYFDYWIAPNAGNKVQSLRQQFLASKAVAANAPSAAELEQAGKAAFGIYPSAGMNSAGKKRESVLEGEIMRSTELPTDSKAPVRPEVRAAFNAQWDASSTQQREAMAQRPDWVGMLARERAGVFERSDTNSSGMPVDNALTRVDARVENRRNRLVAQGIAPEVAQRAAQEAAAAGIAPGQEIAYLDKKYGSIKPSTFDFETKQAFDPNGPSNGLNNPLVRGLAKAGLGVGKMATGMGEFYSDLYGLDYAGKAMRKGSDALRGKENAIGESGTFLERNLEGAISSIAQQLPLMIAGVKGAKESVILGGMALQSFGQEYSDGRAKGQSVQDAMTRASLFAAFEVIGEKFGLGETIKAYKAAAQGLPSDQIIGFLWSALKKEVPGEVLTTTGQFAVDKFAPKGVALNPNATGADYLKQIADTIAQTLMQSGITAGGTTGVSRAVQFLNEPKMPEDQFARALQQDINDRSFTREGINEQVVRSMNPNGAIYMKPPGQVQQVADPEGRIDPTLNPEAPAPAAPAQTDSSISDEDVLDYATTRLDLLQTKLQGTGNDSVDPFTEQTGGSLTPTETEELRQLQAAGEDPAKLRRLYGFDQPQPENSNETQQPTQTTGSALSQDASSQDGLTSGTTSEQQPAGQTPGAEGGAEAGERQQGLPAQDAVNQDDDIPDLGAPSNVSEGDAMRSLGFSEQEITNTAQPPKTEKEAKERRNGTEAPQAQQAEAQGQEAPAAPADPRQVVFDAFKEAGASDTAAAGQFDRVQQVATDRQEPMVLWRSPDNDLAFVPQSKGDAFKKGSQAIVTIQPGKPQSEPLALPKTEKEAKAQKADEPPLADGMTRLYHGSAKQGRYDGKAWFSTNRNYASNYRTSAELQYVDVPTEQINKLADPDGYGQTPDKGFTFNAEFDSADVGLRKPLVAQATPKTEREAKAQKADGKWFGTQAKADDYIAKNGLATTHEVVKNGTKFEIKAKSSQPAQPGGTPGEGAGATQPTQLAPKTGPELLNERINSDIEAKKAKAKADLDAALGDLGDLLGKGTRLNIMPEDEQKLLPILTRVMDAAFRMGYYKFKDAARFVLNTIREKLGQDVSDQITLDHLQGSYIGMAGKYQAEGTASSKKDVIAVESLDELNVQEIEKKSTEPAVEPADLYTPEGKFKVAQTLADEFIGGASFKTIIEARKRIGELIGKKIEAATELAKQADETIEVAVVLAAREIVKAGRAQKRSAQVIYDRLVSLYNAQPNLAVRSSTSVRDQAYSTPVPLAFVASELAGVTDGTKLIESTAGNGMLTIGAKVENVTANELNPRRVAMLHAMGIMASKDNAATQTLAPAKSQDAVVINPPFGATKDEQGNTIVYTVSPNYGTREVDHAIAFKTLDTMKDDGRAVLIVGGSNATSDEGRQEDYRGKNKRAFYFNLYQQYNVVDHFTVDGSLYSKQGASYPVDVIVIEGRGKSSRDLPAASLPQIVRSYDELKEKLNGTRSVGTAGVQRPTGTDSGQDKTGQGDGAGVVGGPVGQGERTGGEGQPTGTEGGVQGTGDAIDGQSAGSGPVSGATQPRTDAATGSESDRGQPVSGDGGRAQPGSEGRAGNQSERLGGPSVVAGERVGSGLSDRRGEEQETSGQVAYTPHSNASSVGTLVPRAMRDAIDASLQKIEEQVGNLDDYVADRLAMDPDTVRTNFSAEQVDALALAIKNAEEGRGFIIGDQTGIGKGRVVAAMIRYALVNDKTPIFVTEKPNLYADMIRDLDDIGMTDELGLDTPKPRILMTNSKEPIPYVLLRTVNGEVTENKLSLKSPKSGAALDAMFKEMMSNDSLGDYKVIFTTYNQLQTVKGKVTERMRLVQQFGSGNYMIFDESHNAGGAGETQARTKEQREKAKEGESLVTGRAAFVRNLVGGAYGTFFSSATYAKRPDVMDLYSSTNMKLAVDKISQLAEAIKNGGVPMQQVVANMLTTDGQYIRRERTFAGVSYDTVETKVDKQTAENMASAMRSVLAFSRAKEVVIKNIQKEMDKEGQMVREMGGEAATIQGSNFGSIMHNLIDQMLLSLKAQDSIRHAVERLKAGEKVVLTVSNTMGSFLKDYSTEMGLNVGDPVALSFADLYLRYLDKQRMVTIKDAAGVKSQRRLTDKELGPGLVKMYEDIAAQIGEAGFGSAPISPIDYLHNELRKLGYKTDEITGRTVTLNYAGANPVLTSRNADIKQRLAAISGFNGGTIDVLILNQSGSTGLSLHANSKFKDQRKRHMIIVQAEKNIDTHMQMLGRVHRTGQVIAPAYSQMMADVPAEMRPAAVLLKKMASLNANTTASRKSSVTAEGVVDFMNDYGGQVVQDYLRDNPDVHDAIGGKERIELIEDSSEADEESIRKFTGYIPILPIKQQEAIYRDLIDRYNELIERENTMGTNKLEAKAVDLDAETVSTQQITEDKGDPSIFASPANMERVDVKRTVKPFSSKEVQDQVDERLGSNTAAQVGQEQQTDLKERAQAFAQERVASMQKAADPDPVRIEAQKTLLNMIYANTKTILDNYYIGQPVSIKDKLGMIVYGVITDIRAAKRTANPASGSDWKMQIALANGDAKTLNLTFSQIGSKYTIQPESRVQWFNAETQQSESMSVLNIFDKGATSRREKRWMVTGNILAGFSKYPGQIITYTKKDGTTGQGVLMSRQFDFEKEQKNQPVRFKTGMQALKFIDEANGTVGTEDGVLRILRSGSRYSFIVPSSKREGGTYYLDRELTKLLQGDFYKRGNTMVASLYYADDAVKVIDYLINTRQEPISALTHQDKAKAMLGQKGMEGPTVSEPGGSYNVDPYANTETRPGTTDAQRAVGRAAVADLSRRIGVHHISKRNTANRIEATVLGSRMYANFVAGKPNALIGQVAKTNADFAALAQVYRDPRFETIRIVYMQGDTIVGESGYTSRLPGAVKAPKDLHDRVAADMQRFGADGYYMMHNHPSGRAEPSENDKRFTIDLGSRVPGLRSHVVIDFNEYAVIDADGTSKVIDAPQLNGTDFKGAPELANRLLGVELNSPGQLAGFAKQLQIERQHATLILTDRGGETQLIVDLPVSVLFDTSRRGILKAKALIRRMARDTGSGGHRFIVLPDGMNPLALKAWVTQGLVTDLIALNGLSVRENTVADIPADFIDAGRSMEVREEDGPKYSVPRVIAKAQRDATQFFGNQENLRTFGLYDRTLSTQYNKALKDADYGKVFAYVNAMQNEVSLTSIRPAELAPGILRKIDDFGSAIKTLATGSTQNKSLKGATNALLAGTLNGKTVLEGKVFTEEELRNNFGLDDAGVALYEQARAAINASLDEVAAAEAFSLAQGYIPKQARRQIIENPKQANQVVFGALGKARKMLLLSLENARQRQASDEKIASLEETLKAYDDTADKLKAVFARSRDLKAAGYMPLMRFGDYTVTVQMVDADTGNLSRDDAGDGITDYFGMFETQAEANVRYNELQARYANDPTRKVSKGVKSNERHKLYQGISPETLALFAEEVGADKVLQEYYKVALSERSSLKRRLERKNVAGFSDDLPRILSNFITSNGRFAAQRYYMRDLNNAIKFIPKSKGDVIDEAIKLREFIMNPNDPGAPVSAIMFSWFLGGSLASALVNLTQPVLMTGPYLSQFGVGTATTAMAKAMPIALGKKQITDQELRNALKRASQEGIVEAQEIFHLYSQGAQGVSVKLANALSKLPLAGNKLKAGTENVRARSEAFFTLWGMMFATAESFNRKLTFVAAWEVAKERKERNPYAFAVRAVNETQGIYNKANRPDWARGTTGRVLLTFKQFSIMYVELLSRMVKRGGPEGKRAALIMLGMLMLAAGEEGLPFSQDLDDLIDTLGQLLGYDTNMKRSKRRAAYEILGKTGGDLFLYGASSQLPLDLAGRLGLGNLIPGTGMFKASAEGNKLREVTEVVGPAGSLAAQINDAYEAWSEGNMSKAMQNLAPKAVKDAMAGGDMATTGTAKDTRGRKNMDVTLADAAIKSVGFNPTKLAEASRARGPLMQDRAIQRNKEASIVDTWARGIATNDQELIKQAEQKLKDWNAKNPDTKVSVSNEQIRAAARQYMTDQNSRIIKSSPREIRGRVGLDLAN